MKSIKITIPLGKVASLRFIVGDEDKNGVVDVSVGLRIVGLFDFAPPPLNLDAALAAQVIEAAGKLKDALSKAKG